MIENLEVKEYTPAMVAKLLHNYADIRSLLVDRMPKPSKVLYPSTTKYTYTEGRKPVGATDSRPWPFMSKPHSVVKVDGKRKARGSEELHCCLIDLEAGLQTLKDEEFNLLHDYYILGDMTMEDLAQSRGLASKGRLSEKIQRILVKLTKAMNNEPL